MTVLEVGYLSLNRGVLFAAPTRDSSICDCCASTYEPSEYREFYGINVSLSPCVDLPDQKTDEVVLPSGEKLYITVATEPFEERDDDDDIF